MSYDTYEQSVAEGKPILLFDFLSSIGTHWRLTSDSETVTYGSYDYEPAVVEHESIEIADISEVNAVNIKLTKGHALATQFVGGPIEGSLEITIYRGHEGNYVTYWRGMVVSVSFDENSIPTLRCEPRTSSLPRMGHRRVNQRLCDHALYDNRCAVIEGAFEVNGTIATIDELEIVSSAFATRADGWFEGGKIQIGHAVRLITYHVTNTIHINRIISDAAPGNSFVAWAGCDHTPTACKDKFSNKLNYGGNEFLSVKNPFESDIRSFS